MIKCPNCGSTAQPKIFYTHNTERTTITETIVCGCGCTTTAFYKLRREVARTADGTQIWLRKEIE